jgi:histone H3/H4
MPKQTEEVEVTRKGKAKHEAITVAAVIRLLKDNRDIRCGALAGKVAQEGAERLLIKIAKAGQQQLKLRKAKTLTRKDLEHIIETQFEHMNLDKAFVIGKRAGPPRRRRAAEEGEEAPKKGKKHPPRGLSVAGVEKIVRNQLGDNHISQTAKDDLVAIGETYIINLGKMAAKIAVTAGRKTIQVKDIKAANEFTMRV